MGACICLSGAAAAALCIWPKAEEAAFSSHALAEIRRSACSQANREAESANVPKSRTVGEPEIVGVQPSSAAEGARSRPARSNQASSVWYAAQIPLLRVEATSIVKRVQQSLRP
jgi:hypothetical protein